MGGWQTKFNVSPGPGLWSLVFGHVGPDLGPDLGPGPGPELDKKSKLVEMHFFYFLDKFK